MNKCLIASLFTVVFLYTAPMVSNASISISFGTGNAYRGYNHYDRYDQCYYPCYNRYGQAYACYLRTGAACSMRQYHNPYAYSSNSYYYNPAPRIWIDKSYKRWDRDRGYKRSNSYQRHYRH